MPLQRLLAAGDGVVRCTPKAGGAEATARPFGNAFSPGRTISRHCPAGIDDDQGRATEVSTSIDASFAIAPRATRRPARSSQNSFISVPLWLVRDSLIGAVVAGGLQRRLKRAIRDSANGAVSVGTKIDVFNSAIDRSVDPEFGRPFGELHAIDVITAGSHAPEEDRLDRSELTESREASATACRNLSTSCGLIPSKVGAAGSSPQ